MLSNVPFNRTLKHDKCRVGALGADYGMIASNGDFVGTSQSLRLLIMVVRALLSGTRMALRMLGMKARVRKVDQGLS